MVSQQTRTHINSIHSHICNVSLKYEREYASFTKCIPLLLISVFLLLTTTTTTGLSQQTRTHINSIHPHTNNVFLFFELPYFFLITTIEGHVTMLGPG